MDLAATAVLHLAVHQYQTIIDGIFRLNAVLHNTGQLQRLARRCHVWTTVSGVSEIETMPSAASQSAKSG